MNREISAMRKFMKRLLLVSTVVLLLFAMVVPISAGKPENLGFILKDTDAAYADFTEGPLFGCNVFVGYVSTDRANFLGEPGGFRPHSDLQVTLTGDNPACSGEGTVDTLNDPLAGITELGTAYVHGINVPLGGGRYATVDLDWTAGGEVIDWKVTRPGMHASHETRLADVEGTVLIFGTPPFGVNEDQVRIGSDELDAPRITHYDEVNARP